MFGHDAANAMAFFGLYLEATPHARLVWTNDEGGDRPVTTVTFEDKGGKTLLVLRELYPSKKVLDAGAGAADAMGKQFEQLDALLVNPGGERGTDMSRGKAATASSPHSLCGA